MIKNTNATTPNMNDSGGRLLSLLFIFSRFKSNLLTRLVSD